MIKHPVWRALIAAAVALAAIWLLGRVLLSTPWLTTPGWLLAWAGRDRAWRRGLRRPRSVLREGESR